MNIALEELATPTRQAERATVLSVEVPPFRIAGEGESHWEVNRERNRIVESQRRFRQEQKVCDKRFALLQLAALIDKFKSSVEGQHEAIIKYAKDNDLEEMLDFCVWDTYSIDPVLESNPVEAALKWMHSDHSC